MSHLYSGGKEHWARSEESRALSQVCHVASCELLNLSLLPSVELDQEPETRKGPWAITGTRLRERGGHC